MKRNTARAPPSYFETLAAKAKTRQYSTPDNAGDVHAVDPTDI